jgi:ABC-type polysaccharide/polyol phosphate export permease
VWTLIFPQTTPGFVAYVLVALIPYNFFTYCLSGCAASIHGNVTLVKRIRFPRQILPISVILTHLIHFGIQSLLVVGAIAIFSPDPTAAFRASLLWLPAVLLVHVGLAVGVGLLVAALTVFYRDVQYVVESLLTILFWLSPILYLTDYRTLSAPRLNAAGERIAASTLEARGEWLYYVYHLNPLSGILEAYRSVLYHGRSPDLYSFGVAAVMTVVIGYFGVKSFWKHERNFADMM